MTSAPPSTGIESARAELRRLLPQAAEPHVALFGQPQREPDGNNGYRPLSDARWLQSLRAALVETDPIGSALKATRTAVERFRLTELWQQIRADPDAGADPAGWPGRRAREATAGQTKYVRRRVEESALELLHHAFYGFEPGRPVAPWAVGVLRNRMHDIFREPIPEPIPTGHAAGDRASAHDAVEAVREEFLVLRAALDGANFFPGPANVDYYAVFVFDLRMRLAERLAAADAVEPAPLAVAANWLPWPAWVGPRRFRPGWPRLAEVWAEAVRIGRIPRGRGSRVAFIGECVRAAPSPLVWANATWNQWVCRAREDLRPRVAPAVWEGSLQHLFCELGGRSL